MKPTMLAVAIAFLGIAVGIGAGIVPTALAQTVEVDPEVETERNPVTEGDTVDPFTFGATVNLGTGDLLQIKVTGQTEAGEENVNRAQMQVEVGMDDGSGEPTTRTFGINIETQGMDFGTLENKD